MVLSAEKYRKTMIGVHPVVARARSVAAVYAPPYTQVDGEVIAGALQLIVDDQHELPSVTLFPPGRRGEDIASISDRVLLMLDPQLLDARMLAADRQDACDPYLFRMVDVIRCGFRAGVLPSAEYLESLVPDLSDHLARHYPMGRRRRERHGLSDNRKARALALIEQRLPEPLAVNEIASAVHLSAFHFARMFRRSTGMSPHEYVTSRRMEKAKTMLALSDVALAEIARRVGYRTQAHFTRVFHERTGTTPRRFRHAAQDQEPK